MQRFNFIELIIDLAANSRFAERILLDEVVGRLTEVSQDNSKVFQFLESYCLSTIPGDLGMYLRELTVSERTMVIQGILNPSIEELFAVENNFYTPIYKQSWEDERWKWLMIELLARLNMCPKSEF